MQRITHWLDAALELEYKKGAKYKMCGHIIKTLTPIPAGLCIDRLFLEVMSEI